MSVTSIIAKRASYVLKHMMTVPIQIFEKRTDNYDEITGVRKPSKKEVWKGKCSFQLYHDKQRGNNTALDGSQLEKADGRVYLPYEALKNSKSNELLLVVNDVTYTIDTPPVDVAFLGVYWDVEITGPKDS